ncbi:glycosyl transferase [Thioalkalicoccus limnaeus]|uniref:Glycosyl transferase n=1 Tax=Thioalkalicoccus limnaeus TaxID=120681 RepID=A0ABV4BEK2_9GAMM
MTPAPELDPKAPVPRAHRLSNGRYEVLISASGAGQSRWGRIALTRWHDDPVQDDLGSFVYLRDDESGRFWSVGRQPTLTPALRYRVQASPERVLFEREDDGIAARLEVRVAAGADREDRSLLLINRSSRPRRIEITSYLEVVLFAADADAAHPALAKFFVETERDPPTGALLARRRPRANSESWPWLVHALVGREATEWETDRMQFLGRGGTRCRPAALTGRPGLSGTVGRVLDPILSLRTRVELPVGGRAEVAFSTGVAPRREAALAMVSAARLSETARLPSAVAGSLGRRASAATHCAGRTDLEGFNGYGGFSADGQEYVIALPWVGDALRRPPLPWINVLANEHFGLLVSEVGAGFTWSRNSQANRLTPWSNDPVSDPHGEALYLRDEDSGEVWSPLPGPMPAPVGYETRHGFGYSRFRCDYKGLKQEAYLFVPRSDPLRVLRLRLTNNEGRPRTLSLYAYQRLIMGAQPTHPSPIRTDWDPGLKVLTATNTGAGAFAGAAVFGALRISGTKVIDRDHSCDRLAFLGRHGDPARPWAVLAGVPLDGSTGLGVDPCFAARARFTLAPGDSAECLCLLGECLEADRLPTLLARYGNPGSPTRVLDEVRAFWRELVGRIQVETPSPAIDRMLNGWLVYQAIACRIWGRSAFYQSGGAYGFRDQLQDAANLATIWPGLARAQILLHAAHQFVEGDVLHWWHPAPLECGLRTRFADDLLWLPWATCHYLRVTGDAGILTERQPFLAARALAPGEDEAYLEPDPSDEEGDLYEHCCRALDRSLACGAHGLPLMGTGDWNDGMNRVGREGRGESVWLGFFLYKVLGDFLPLCAARADHTRQVRYGAHRDALRSALERAGWDGAWYRRAYYDDGTPLGSASDAECRIDALAQAWSVISGAAPRERAELALDAVEAHLIDDTTGLIRLLTPPFVDTPRDPGYIKGYLAGVRENGGQYTHAACWVVMAMAQLGRRERAAHLLERLSPIWHTATPERVATYRLEPYALAADLYGAPPHTGRGGWSWYTGSAAWMYQVGIESLLGLRVEDGRILVLRPCIPADWPGFRLSYRLPDGMTDCSIQVENGGGQGVPIAAFLDGIAVQVVNGALRVRLPDCGGSYRLCIRLG